MAKGIIYVMSTVVQGLIKIGRTQTNQFETRMNKLESDGYRNVTGLHREFAIEVDNYEEKEHLLHTIFDRSRVPNTELFALNIDLIKQLLSSFEGKQIYPLVKEISKEDIFTFSADVLENNCIPDGTYYLDRKIKKYNQGIIHAEMTVKSGVFTVLKGSDICPIINEGFKSTKRRDNAKIKNNKLLKNEQFTSCSMAGQFVIGAACNGWKSWKTKDGIPLDNYRKKLYKE